MADTNKGTEEQGKKAEKLVEVLKCKRNRLSTRQITCKDNSLTIHKKLE